MYSSQASWTFDPGLCHLIHHRSVYEFYGQGASYEELHRRIRTNHALWSRFIPDTSFKFFVTAYSHRIPQTRQREVVESFSYMGLLGKIDMNDPDIIFGCFEECTWPYKAGSSVGFKRIVSDNDRQKIVRNKYEGDGQFRQVFFGRLVCLFDCWALILEVTSMSCFPTIPKLEEGSARQLISKFNVKQRVYYGNTSMESEMSLLMANQALVNI